MSGILSQYPMGDPIIRGDSLTIPVTFSEDISGWEWIAQVRSDPDADDAIDFAITPGTDPAHQLLLSLTPDKTVLLADGYGWDLQSTAPDVKTWVLCKYLRVQRDYSHD